MTIFYPDISSAQTGMPFTKTLVAVVKATEGTTYTNPDYVGAKARAASAGAFFVAYHFLRQGNAAAQAQHAINVVGKGVPLMLDWETESVVGSYPKLADAIGFIDAYRKLGGIVFLLYLPKWYWENLGAPPLTDMQSRGMLLVSSDYTAYTDADTGAGWLPYGGIAPTVWQYSDSTSFNAKVVDFNAFRGHFAGKQDAASVAACLAEFESLALTGAYAKPTPPPAPVNVKVPVVIGKSAGRAHDTLVAAKLVPVAVATQTPDMIVTGTTPAGGTSVKPNANVTILAATAPSVAEGATGAWVAMVQRDLNKAGAKLSLDGKFGVATLGAIEAFQRARGLAVDGVVGPLTWAALGAL